MFPEISEAFGASISTVAWSMSAYTFSLAICLVFSGTLGARWGRERTIRGAYVAYAVASIACILAPSMAWFLGARAFQGVANAFITPLLVASIYEAVQRARLGRSLGWFASFQAAGMAFAPLAGGIAGAFDYRSAFIVIAVVSLLLASLRPPGGRPVAAPSDAEPAAKPSGQWKALFNRRLVMTCAVAVTFHTTATGLIILTAIFGADEFGLGPTQRGLVVAGFGVAGMLAASFIGRLVDRLGVLRIGVGAFVVLGVAAAAAGFAPSVWWLFICAAVGGAAATGSRAVVNTLSITSTPDNRSGAASITMSFLFLGSAIAPLTVLPVYLIDPQWGFIATASGALAAAVIVIAVNPSRVGDLVRTRGRRSGQTAA